MNPNGAPRLRDSNAEDYSPIVRPSTASSLRSLLTETAIGTDGLIRSIGSAYDLPINGADVLQSVGAARGAERSFDREPGRDGGDFFGARTRARSCRRASLSGGSAALPSRGNGRLRGDRERHFRRESKFTGVSEACRRRRNGQGSGASFDARNCDANFYRRNDAA